MRKKDVGVVVGYPVGDVLDAIVMSKNGSEEREVLKFEMVS